MSKITKSKIYILVVICLLVMCISGIYAFTNISVLLVNTEISTGAVKIELKEYAIDNNGKEVLFNNNDERYLPGQTISIIPRISNLGDSCYIRAKVSYTGIDNELINANNNVNNINNDWVKKGDYWYYKKIVNSNDSVDIFKEFRIPREISNEYQDKTIQLSIVAEAVQSKNFNVDFNSNAPWGNIEAQKAYSNEYKTDKIQVSSGVRIKYENNAEAYIDAPDNFFGELNNVLPGDVIIQQIKLKNTSSENAEYLVSTSKPEGISAQQLELLNKLQLIIRINDKVINYSSLGNVNNCSLGNYKPNESATVKFEVIVPETLGNEYASLNTSLDWKFSVNVEEKQEEPTKPDIPASPQTGDVKVIIAIVLFVVSAIGLVVLCIVERKTREND